MWIRNETKDILMKVDILEAELNQFDEGVIVGHAGDDQTDLAYYSNHERALQVLDYIQNAIKKGEKVYTMPEK